MNNLGSASQIRVVLAVFWVLPLGIGCNRTETIGLDLTSTPVRFIVDHEGWPRPFWWPRITEFAIASEEDGQVWSLHTDEPEGVLCREVGIVYGEVPPGFYQTFPEQNKHPARLQMGRVYYVAAGGPDAIYRLVFSLPVERGIPLDAGRAAATQPIEPAGP